MALGLLAAVIAATWRGHDATAVRTLAPENSATLETAIRLLEARKAIGDGRALIATLDGILELENYE